MDKREQLVQSIQLNFSPSQGEELRTSLLSSADFENFLSNPILLTLAISYNKDTKSFDINQSITENSTSDGSRTLVLIKDSREDMEEKAEDMIQIIPLKNSPLGSLYQSIHSVYAPMLVG
jgi:hypothetical protein